jgi:hypothetical protein
MLEEAHEYVPLTPAAGEEVMLGAMKRLYTVGRNYWIGFIAATRRPAKMHTDLRNGADITAFFQIVGTQDRKAMTDYLGEMADKEIRDEILSHLAKLEVGTAYWYQPDQLPPLQRLHFRHRNTLDTTTTEITAAHKAFRPVLAEVDLSKLGDAMAAAREKAKAEDPRELRKRIQELEREIKNIKPAAAPPPREVEKVVERLVQVPIGAEEIPHIRDLVVRVQEIGKELGLIGLSIDNNRLAVLKSSAALLKGQVAKPVDRIPSRPTPASVARPVPPAEQHTNGKSTYEGRLGKGERKVLSVLAQWPDGRVQRDLAFLTGYSARASTLGVILSKLRQAELVEPGQPIRATQAGLEAAGGVQQLPTGPELLEHWLNHPRIGEGERKVLRALIDAYPEALTHAACRSSASSAWLKAARDACLTASWRRSHDATRSQRLPLDVGAARVGRGLPPDLRRVRRDALPRRFRERTWRFPRRRRSPDPRRQGIRRAFYRATEAVGAVESCHCHVLASTNWPADRLSDSAPNRGEREAQQAPESAGPPSSRPLCRRRRCRARP